LGGRLAHLVKWLRNDRGPCRSKRMKKRPAAMPCAAKRSALQPDRRGVSRPLENSPPICCRRHLRRLRPAPEPMLRLPPPRNTNSPAPGCPAPSTQ